jgi:hypothetical protein
VAFFWHSSRKIVTLLSQEGCPGVKLISFGFAPTENSQPARVMWGEKIATERSLR